MLLHPVAWHHCSRVWFALSSSSSIIEVGQVGIKIKSSAAGISSTEWIALVYVWKGVKFMHTTSVVTNGRSYGLQSIGAVAQAAEECPPKKEL